MDSNEIEDHDRGFSHDLPTLLDRRRALGLLSGVGLAAALAACSGDRTPPSGTSASSSGSSGTTTSAAAHSGTTTAANLTEIPEETAGPFPGDGSNGVNVLTETGIVRSDLTASFGTGSGVATGVPLTVTMTVLDTANGATPLAGAAVYAWHCDQQGRYSLYSDGVTGENYLRGVQQSDADGAVTFRTVFPGAYAGRWPHIHVEAYPNLSDATTASNKMRTSQLALPEKTCRQVYATEGYAASMANLTRTPLAQDMVFADGYSLQMARVTGTVAAGLTATLVVPV